jgi:NitT/TauT family transport system substrate-binding protein
MRRLHDDAVGASTEREETGVMNIRYATILGLALMTLAAAAPPKAAAQTKLAVTQYGKVISSLPWAIALEKGWLKENGLKVESILSSDGGGTSMRNMLASDLPFGESAISAAVAAHLKAKLDIVLVYGGGDSIGELTWMSLPDSPVKTIEDMRGKTISFTNPQSATEMLLRLVLAKHGIAPDAMKLVASGSVAATITALNQHGIDAGPVSDPLLYANEDKLHTVFAASTEIPRYEWYAGVTTKEFATQHPEQIRALIAARRKAVKFIAEQPDAAAAIYAKVWELDEKTAALMLKRAARYRYWSEGEFDKEGIATVTKGLQLAGVTEEVFNLNSIIDQSFLPEALRRPL